MEHPEDKKPKKKDPRDNPKVMKYFHVSAEMAVYMDEIKDKPGREKNDEEEIARRISICIPSEENPCTYFENGRCKVCSCGLNLRVRMKNLHCPIGKW